MLVPLCVVVVTWATGSSEELWPDRETRLSLRRAVGQCETRLRSHNGKGADMTDKFPERPLLRSPESRSKRSGKPRRTRSRPANRWFADPVHAHLQPSAAKARAVAGRARRHGTYPEGVEWSEGRSGPIRVPIALLSDRRRAACTLPGRLENHVNSRRGPRWQPARRPPPARDQRANVCVSTMRVPNRWSRRSTPQTWRATTDSFRRMAGCAVENHPHRSGSRGARRMSL